MIMKKYKLTDQNMQTHNGCQWQLGVAKETDGNSSNLCNSHWLHYYDNPLLAVLFNPMYADISNPKLFEVKALGKHLKDMGLKGGCTKMVLINEIPLPEISTNQKIAFAILCSLKVYKEERYVKWAKNWLGGADRSEKAADAAYAAADAYARAARAARAAADAADAAADAAYAAYAAADVAARAARAAADAADAARAARAAADAAADAAYAADAADAAINFIKLAKKALKYD
jgi:hypothetical protein